MTTIERTVSTTRPPDAVFPYLVDVRNAVEWDLATVSCDRVSGDRGPGTVYRTVSEFAGTEVELRYTVETVDEPRGFVIVGHNDSTTSHDTITVSPRPERGSPVAYRAELTCTGVTKLAGPIMRPLLDRLGDRTAEQLETALDRL
jgi:hypothetical protein